MPDEVQAQGTLGSQAATPSKPPKNIVICCDGTGNEFGDENSNVVKLYTALAIDREQVGYYHPGVGTMGDPAERHRIPRYWSKVKGLAFAAGFKDNIFDAYRYLMEMYHDGDQVFFFGFSRGAYTVRALAGLLDGYGLLCRGNEGHLPYAWCLYLDQHKDREKRHIDHQQHAAAAFKETFSRKNFSIHFVGVWDTVSSVGWVSSPLRLFNVAQNRTIRIGRHAISIDERRCFYHDNLWGQPLPEQDLKQVWFAGVHSDVGGSYPQDQSVLSNIALEWMLNEARAADLKLVEDRVQMVLGNASSSYPNAQELYRKPTKSMVHHSLKGMWWLLEFFPHIHYNKDLDQEEHRIPLGACREIPDGSLVHHSVLDRLQDKSLGYAPANLDSSKLKPLTAGATIPQSGKPLLYEYARGPVGKPSALKRIALLVLFTIIDIVVLSAVAAGIVAVIAFLWLLIRHGLHCAIWGIG